jgi:hypothetical protein
MAAPRKYSLEWRERAVRMYRTTEPKLVFTAPYACVTRAPWPGPERAAGSVKNTPAAPAMIGR